MAILVGVVSSQIKVTSGTSGQFTNPMVQGGQYLLRCEAAAWVKVTATGGAAAADTADNHFVPAGGQLLLANLESSGTTNSFVHVIQDAAAGQCVLTLLGTKNI